MEYQPEEIRTRLYMQEENKKQFRTFAIASFLNDFGSDVIYPVWPLFVTRVLGANMEVLGFLDGLGEAMVSLSQAASGYASDKIRRRKIFIWTGYLFGSFSRIGYAFSASWQHLVPFRVLDRFGKIRSAPRDAIVADISTPENRGRNFGMLRSIDNIGAVCGILFCIAFFELGYKTLFLLAAIPSVFAASLILFSVRERSTEGLKIFKGLSFKDLNKNFWLFLILSSFFALGSFSYSFLLIYANTFGVKPSLVPVLYLIYTGVAALFSLPFGKLSDSIGRRNVIFISFIFWGLVCLGFLFERSYWGIVMIFVIYGLHKAAIEPVQRALVSEFSPAAYKASTLGGFQMVIGLCALPSSFVAGFLWDKISLSAPLYFSIATTAVSLVLLCFVREEKRAA